MIEGDHRNLAAEGAAALQIEADPKPSALFCSFVVHALDKSVEIGMPPNPVAKMGQQLDAPAA